MTDDIVEVNICRNTAFPDFKKIGNTTKLSIYNQDEKILMQVLPNICELGSLRDLWLCRSGLTNLPEECVRLTNLTHLNLTGNRLSRVPNCVMQMNSLLTLWLHKNQLKEFSPNMNQLTRLMQLCLSSNYLTDKGLHGIMERYSRDSNLLSLGLSGPGHNFTNEVLEHLVDFIKNNITLVSLSLSSNNIMETGIQQISNALDTNTTLRKLYLCENPGYETLYPDDYLDGLYICRETKEGEKIKSIMNCRGVYDDTEIDKKLNLARKKYSLLDQHGYVDVDEAPSKPSVKLWSAERAYEDDEDRGWVTVKVV